MPPLVLFLAVGASCFHVRVGCPQRKSVVVRSDAGDDPATRQLLRVLEDASEDKRSSGGVRDEYGTVVYKPSYGNSWGAVHFVGGAAFGTYPDLAYGLLLSRLSERTGVTCVATPFDLSLDHFEASRSVDIAFRRALDDDMSKVFGLGHSLGSKLLLLLQAEDETKYDSLTLVASNNFGLAESARLASTFLEAVNNEEPAWTGLLDLALAAAASAGFDVSPSPRDTLDIVQSISDIDATFISFADDQLDSSADLVDALRTPVEDGVKAVQLAGGHLNPVYIPNLGLGSIDAVDALVDAIAATFTESATRRPSRPLLLPASS